MQYIKSHSVRCEGIPVDKSGCWMGELNTQLLWEFFLVWMVDIFVGHGSSQMKISRNCMIVINSRTFWITTTTRTEAKWMGDVYRIATAHRRWNGKFAPTQYLIPMEEYVYLYMLHRGRTTITDPNNGDNCFDCKSFGTCVTLSASTTNKLKICYFSRQTREISHIAGNVEVW